MLKAVPIASVPRAKTFIQHVKDSSNFTRACASVRMARRHPRLLSFRLPSDLVEKLRLAALDAIRRHGVHGWLSKEGRLTEGYYDSLSLTYNPQLRDPCISDVHQSTLGSSVNPSEEFYYGATGRFKGHKGPYFDTYGFRRPTPAAKSGHLGEFLAQCKLSLVRSRLSVLRGEGGEPPFLTGWHRDEPVFENLRINIPLTGSPDFQLQVEHRRDAPEEDSGSMSTHFLEPGRAFTFDTHKPHRVFPVRKCKQERIHLVLGFSPWFRYDEARDAWAPNEHYGVRHPFDIVCDGGLHPGIRRGAR